MSAFEKGDRVTWRSHGGEAVGEVLKIITSDTEAASRTVRASKDAPQYLVRSEKSGGEAAHKALGAEEGLRQRASQEESSNALLRRSGSGRLAVMTTSTLDSTVIRPLRDDDVEAADNVAWSALHEVGEQFGFSMGVRDEARIAWAHARIRHIALHDPEGSVVAERDGEVIGIGLATPRESLWFLSLLAVRSGLQGGGVGRRLLDATLDYGRDCPRAMICASPDPKALRRYGRAGFALHAAYEASGIADRSELPADLGVREGDWDRDRDLFEQLVTERRGAPMGPDLDFWRERGMRLLVRDGATPADRAVITSRPSHLGTLAAASDEAASRVLWAAIAETAGEITVGYLLGNQQWAIDVALAARLPLKLTDTLCTRGLQPPTPYLPSGIFG